MNIEDFRYITTIAELGSFSGAARELFIAQPSLSQRVKYIEASYGITIFIRDSHGVRLTEDGKCFVHYANEILGSESILRKTLSDRHADQIPVINVGTTQLIGSYIFDSLINEFHNAFPKTRFVFVTGTSEKLQEQTLSGELDIAVIYNRITLDKKIAHQNIYQDSVVLLPAAGGSLEQKILARPNGGYEPVDFHLLDGEVFALPPREQYLAAQILAIAEKTRTNLDVQHNAKNFNILYNLAKSGIASTILLESYFNPDMEYIPYYYLDLEDFSFPISLIWRKGSYVQKTVQELIRLSKDFFKNSPAS